MRWLELFSGIGGAAQALPDGAVLRAIDHDEHAHHVYGLNHGSHAIRRNLASVKPSDLEGAEAWWMSPPCQPYTVRGRRLDLDDPRAQSFVHLLGLMERGEVQPPRRLALENVPGFPGSRAHGRLRAVLRALGYQAVELERCPTELGIPMVRRRYYLLADRDGAVSLPPVTPRAVALGSFLRGDISRATHPELYATPALLERYGDNLPTVDARRPDAVTHCFTGAYGRSPVYSGSWLVTEEGLRLLLPEEIAWLLGFPRTFALAVPKRANGNGAPPAGRSRSRPGGRATWSCGRRRRPRPMDGSPVGPAAEAAGTARLGTALGRVLWAAIPTGRRRGGWRWRLVRWQLGPMAEAYPLCITLASNSYVACLCCICGGIA